MSNRTILQSKPVVQSMAIQKELPAPLEGEGQFSSLVSELRETFETRKTTEVSWRKEQLLKLKETLLAFQDDIVEAIMADMGRPRAEILVGEWAFVIAELDMSLKNLANWTSPTKIAQPLLQQPGHSALLPMPKGVMLIISPWNYPIGLSLAGVVAAIAAGNCMIVKPSEMAPHSAKVVERILQTLDQEAVRVVLGGQDETTELLKLRFDHILFTGSVNVGKIVMRAAAEHLTPVTLELGGKSPVIIDESADLATLGNRLLWGKFMNCGQTCIGVDYVIVVESMREKVVAILKETLLSFYGQDPHASTSFGRVINERHWDRLQGLLESNHGGQAWSPEGGTAAIRSERFIPPTLIENPEVDSRLMKEEIFGPLLPIITVKSVDDAIKFVNARERPLALYVFSKNSQTVDKVLQNTTSGGCCVNDTLYHFVNPHLPFGGVGHSGMGSYHGYAGFKEFSHLKPVVWRDTWIDPHLRFPPYTESSTNFLVGLLIGPVTQWRMRRNKARSSTSSVDRPDSNSSSSSDSSSSRSSWRLLCCR